MSSELHYLSIEDASALMRTGAISPMELTGAMLARIEDLDPRLHAYLRVTSDLARTEAAAAEASLSRGNAVGPLHGIPVAYKDNIETKGVRTTAQSRSLRDHVPEADAPVVERLRSAGTICLGKLALHELAYGSPEPDDLFPPARNPWNLDFSPGGSSSGSGTAVAAGLAFGALGTDTGGSIRHPAAVCGLVGMKPTFGLVDTTGIIPLSPSQDHVGPLTRTVRDNALLLGALIGDTTGRRDLPFGSDTLMEEIEGGISGRVIGVPRRFVESLPLQADVAAAFERAVDQLARLGGKLVAVDIPDLAEANRVGTRIILAEAYREYGHLLREHPESFGKPFRLRVLRGADISEMEQAENREFRRKLKATFQDLFRSGIDVVVTPAREETAIELDQLMTNPFDVRGLCTRMYNVTGLPALCLPMGFSSGGLPLALQIAGNDFHEPLLYRAARAYERATGWVTSYPDIRSTRAAKIPNDAAEHVG